MDIILASKSPRRKEILNKINLNFKTINSNFDESVVIIDHKNPAAYCQKLAVKLSIPMECESWKKRKIKHKIYKK